MFAKCLLTARGAVVSPSQCAYTQKSRLSLCAHACVAPPQILELFPSFTADYAARCLAYCEGDAEQAIMLLLEGKMPPVEDLDVSVDGGAGASVGTPAVSEVLDMMELRDEPLLKSRISALIRMRRCVWRVRLRRL